MSAVPAMAPAAQPVLAIEDLAVAFGPVPAVRGVSLDVRPGETLAIVGESGSGKTMLARAILGLLPPGGRATRGHIRFDGLDLLAASPNELRRVRGARIGMIFQEPMASLNPALTIGHQLTEGLRLHHRLGRAEARERAATMLARVRIADPGRCLGSYPHEFSGGMRQRIMLASIFLLRPALLIADEPTTALDKVTQDDVMGVMRGLAAEADTAVLLITHDLGLVAGHADRVAVMRHGQMLETGGVAQVLARPQHDYTRLLLSSLPRRQPRPSPVLPVPILEVEALSVAFPRRPRMPWARAMPHRAVREVSLTVRSGETVCLIGESGSGKTSLGRAVLRLLPASAGTARLCGGDLGGMRGAALRAARLRMQIVFQDPYSALDPRMRVAEIVGEGLRRLRLTTAERMTRTTAMLDAVGLAGFGDRYPHQLSGGQRQRVSIARAVILKPDLIVADEPVSALDMTVQAQILALLDGLQRQHGFGCLFITHDLGVVEQIADRVMVMQRGRIVESGPRDAVLDRPHHPYTRRLLAIAPELRAGPSNTGVVVTRRLPPPIPPGALRTFDAEAAWDSGAEPVMRQVAPEHFVAFENPRERMS